MIPNRSLAPPGFVLARLRAALGYRRQAEVTAAAKMMATQLGKDKVSPISQTSLSGLEAGHITEARLRTLRMLSVLLRLNSRGFEFHTGLPCPEVPLMDGPHAAGQTIATIRLDAGLSVQQVLNAMAAAGGPLERHIYLAIEAGVYDLATQPEEVRLALEHALGLREWWTVLTGLPSLNTDQLPPSGLSIPDAVIARWALFSGHGALPPAHPPLPLIPIEQFYPPTLPSADNLPEQVAVPREVVKQGMLRPGVLLTTMPDSALQPGGPQQGALVLVDTLVDDVKAGKLYVLQAGDRPLVVRRAVLDGLDQVWLLPDSLDFQQFWPVLARDARVIGEVLHTWPPGR